MRCLPRAPSFGILAVAFVAIACRDDSAPGPGPDPVPISEIWYVFPVACSNCPGLTNVEIDRSVAPFRARLRVGQRTSLRAVAVIGCGTEEPVLRIDRWITADPSVVGVDPSSSESAILIALSPGVTRVAADRVLPAGGRSLVGLRDPFPGGPSGCAPLPELLVEIVP